MGQPPRIYAIQVMALPLLTWVFDQNRILIKVAPSQSRKRKRPRTSGDDIKFRTDGADRGSNVGGRCANHEVQQGQRSRVRGLQKSCRNVEE